MNDSFLNSKDVKNELTATWAFQLLVKKKFEKNWRKIERENEISRMQKQKKSESNRGKTKDESEQKYTI